MTLSVILECGQSLALDLFNHKYVVFNATNSQIAHAMLGEFLTVQPI